MQTLDVGFVVVRVELPLLVGVGVGVQSRGVARTTVFASAHTSNTIFVLKSWAMFPIPVAGRTLGCEPERLQGAWEAKCIRGNIGHCSLRQTLHHRSGRV